jgi:hypothetical protein
MQGANATSKGTPNYFIEIQRFPMLKAEEKYLLAARWRDGAAHRLMTSYLRLAPRSRWATQIRPVNLRFDFRRATSGSCRPLSASSRRRVFGFRPMRFGGQRGRFTSTSCARGRSLG